MHLVDLILKWHFQFDVSTLGLGTFELFTNLNELTGDSAKMPGNICSNCRAFVGLILFTRSHLVEKIALGLCMHSYNVF